MSAIWGIIDFDKRIITEDEGHRMRKSFDRCVIDRYEERCQDNVYMGCGIQYFTPEAKNEILPIIEDGVYFDADVVIDNREELMTKLSISDKSITDGRLLYEMYKRYGKDSLNMMRGAYAFVYYDSKNGQADVAIDCTGERVVYYKRDGSRLYYSSLIEPLRDTETKSDINGEWLTDFLSMDHLYMVCETENTPISNVFRIAPAQVVTFTKKSIDKKTYWNPGKNIKVKDYKTDEEYKREFLDIFTDAVKCMIRSEDEISVMLSGGLDSTAVVSVAAPYLKEQGRRIHSYTSVPEKGLKSNDGGYDINDETEYVKSTAKYFGNIDTTFVDMPGMNAWDYRSDELRKMEMPYKSVQNLLWICESMRQAYSNGSRVVLNGSFGNTTISFGDLTLYMNQLYKEHRYIKLLKELTAFQSTFGYSRKYALKQIIKDNKKEIVLNESEDMLGHSYVRIEAVRKYGSCKRLGQMTYNMEKSFVNMDEYRKSMIDYKAFRQIGETGMKHSLATGVLLRDPTRDKRVVEFCVSLPISQYVKNGEDRRLASVYMSDMMPPKVIKSTQKGKQSADLKERCVRESDRIIKEWLEIYRANMNNEFVDCAKAISELENIQTLNDIREYDIVRHIYTLSVIEYVNNIRRTL